VTLDPVAHVESTTDELVATTHRLLAADTRNPPGDTRAIADWVQDELAAVGCGVERFCVDPRKPNVVATVPGEREYTLLFNGHLDTVPFDRSAWSRDPLGELVTVESGDGDGAATDGGDADGDHGDATAGADAEQRLYGRGATDMKGAIGAMLQVARAYTRTDTTPPVTLQFALVSDEEVGGDAGLGARLKSDRLDPDACVVGEATGRRGVDSVAVGDRGYVWPTVEFEGEAAHGSRPAFGVNAVDGLYRVVDEVRSRLRDLETSTALVADDVVEESVDYYAHDLDREAAAALFASPTVNLGRFEGGDAVNSVPASAEASLDVRMLPGVEPETVVQAVRDCVADRDRVTLVDTPWAAGSYSDPEGPFVRAVTAAARSTLPTPVYRRIATGSGDARAFREQGVPTVEFATGTGTVHGVDEYTTRTNLRHDAVAYARLPYELADRLD